MLRNSMRAAIALLILILALVFSQGTQAQEAVPDPYGGWKLWDNPGAFPFQGSLEDALLMFEKEGLLTPERALEFIELVRTGGCGRDLVTPGQQFFMTETVRGKNRAAYVEVGDAAWPSGVPRGMDTCRLDGFSLVLVKLDVCGNLALWLNAPELPGGAGGGEIPSGTIPGVPPGETSWFPGWDFWPGGGSGGGYFPPGFSDCCAPGGWPYTPPLVVPPGEHHYHHHHHHTHHLHHHRHHHPHGPPPPPTSVSEPGTGVLLFTGLLLLGILIRRCQAE